MECTIVQLEQTGVISGTNKAGKAYTMYEVFFSLDNGTKGTAKVFDQLKVGDKINYTFDDKYQSHKLFLVKSGGGLNKGNNGGSKSASNADATAFAGVCGAAGELIAAGKLDIKHFDSFVENKFNLYKKLTAQIVPEPIKPQPSEQRFSEPAAKMQDRIAQEAVIPEPTDDLPF